MGSSFIEYRSYGFWSSDGFTEGLASEVINAIELQAEKPQWLSELAAHWTLQASGSFGGWIDLKLDDFVINEDRRKQVRDLVQTVTDRLPAIDDPIRQTGILLLKLLDGELRTTASSNLDYMVGRIRNVNPSTL